MLTYYAFLALFPLLLVITTITTYIVGAHSGLQKTVLHATTNYFPVLGNQLASHVHGIQKSGVALAVGILFTLYGARGVADIFRQTVRRLWGIPRSEDEGFPKSLLNSMAIIGVGGFGFIAAAIFAGITGSVGSGLAFRILAAIVNFGILFWLFSFLINISLPKQVTYKQIRLGAINAAVGLVILQSLGGYILSRELKSLDALYSYFAIALGLLFWIYLQARMLCYAIEVAAVRSHRLYPRSLSGKNLTAADKRCKKLQLD